MIFADLSSDPSLGMNMMRDPAFAGQMNALLSDPAVVDQLVCLFSVWLLTLLTFLANHATLLQIASNPELAAAGPQVRQLMQSEQFRSFLTNPEAMQQAMGMMGGMGGAGGPGAFPPPGAFGAGAAGAQGQQGQGQGLFNPWGAAPPAAATGGEGAAANPPAAGTPGAFNPFAPAGGAGGAGGMPDFRQMMQQMQQLQQMQQMFGGAGGLGGLDGAPATPSGPVVPPEERYAVRSIPCRSHFSFHPSELTCFPLSSLFPSRPPSLALTLLLSPSSLLLAFAPAPTDPARAARRYGLPRRRQERSRPARLGRKR